MLVERTLMAMLVGVMLFFFVLGFVGIYIHDKREKMMPAASDDKAATEDDITAYGGK